MQADRKKQFHIVCALLYAAVFAAMFLLSLWTPLIADDFNYAFGYSNGERIRSLAEVVKSMYWHRRMLNPRVFSHGWLSVVLMYPRWFFAAMNAAVAVLFTWTSIGFFRDQGVERPAGATACVWMLLWICMPGFGQVFFWTAGACNYFWGVALSWFIIWRATRLEQEQRMWLRTCLLLLPCFAAGAWSEHISFAMLMVLFLLLLWRWVRNRAFPAAKAALLASGCAGYLFMMLAPAARLFQRLHDAGDPTEENNLTRIYSALPAFAPTVLIILAVLLLAMVLIFRKKKGRLWTLYALSFTAATVCAIAAVVFALRAWRNDGIYGVISSSVVGFLLPLGLYTATLSAALKNGEGKDILLLSAILAFSGICGCLLFLFGEYFPLRGFCAPVSMLILAGVLQYGRRGTGEKAGYRKAAAVILGLCFALHFVLGTADILGVHRQAMAREEKFAAAAAGDKIVVVAPFSFKTKYTAQYGNPDLAPDAGWPNGDIADYYGVVRIIVE